MKEKIVVVVVLCSPLRLEVLEMRFLELVCVVMCPRNIERHFPIGVYRSRLLSRAGGIKQGRGQQGGLREQAGQGGASITLLIARGPA